MITAKDARTEILTADSAKCDELIAIIDAEIKKRGHVFTMDAPKGFSGRVVSRVLSDYRTKGGWTIEVGSQYNEEYWSFKPAVEDPGEQ